MQGCLAPSTHTYASMGLGRLPLLNSKQQADLLSQKQKLRGLQSLTDASGRRLQKRGPVPDQQSLQVLREGGRRLPKGTGKAVHEAKLRWRAGPLVRGRLGEDIRSTRLGDGC